MDTLVKFVVVYLLAVVVLAVWLGWGDRRKKKRRHKELVKKSKTVGGA